MGFTQINNINMYAIKRLGNKYQKIKIPKYKIIYRHRKTLNYQKIKNAKKYKSTTKYEIPKDMKIPKDINNKSTKIPIQPSQTKPINSILNQTKPTKTKIKLTKPNQTRHK